MPALPRHLFAAPDIGLGEALTEALCTWEMLRQLGFSADDIYLIAGSLDNKMRGIRIELRAQGKEFTIDIGAVHAKPERIRAAWETRCNQHNSGADSLGWMDVLHGSQIWARRVDFVFGLKLKGFKLVSDAPEVPTTEGHPEGAARDSETYMTGKPRGSG